MKQAGVRALMYDVAAIAIDRKATTVEEIRASFPGKSKHQIQDALHNAAQRKLVSCVRRGGLPAIWGPYRAPDLVTMYSQLGGKKRPPRQFISSVFQLGSPLPESDWPKGWMGTTHRPLGPWHSEEEAQV